MGTHMWTIDEYPYKELVMQKPLFPFQGSVTWK